MDAVEIEFDDLDNLSIPPPASSLASSASIELQQPSAASAPSRKGFIGSLASDIIPSVPAATPSTAPQVVVLQFNSSSAVPSLDSSSREENKPQAANQEEDDPFGEPSIDIAPALAPKPSNDDDDEFDSAFDSVPVALPAPVAAPASAPAIPSIPSYNIVVVEKQEAEFDEFDSVLEEAISGKSPVVAEHESLSLHTEEDALKLKQQEKKAEEAVQREKEKELEAEKEREAQRETEEKEKELAKLVVHTPRLHDDGPKPKSILKHEIAPADAVSDIERVDSFKSDKNVEDPKESESAPEAASISSQQDANELNSRSNSFRKSLSFKLELNQFIPAPADHPFITGYIESSPQPSPSSSASIGPHDDEDEDEQVDESVRMFGATLIGSRHVPGVDPEEFEDDVSAARKAAEQLAAEADCIRRGEVYVRPSGSSSPSSSPRSTIEEERKEVLSLQKAIAEWDEVVATRSQQQMENVTGIAPSSIINSIGYGTRASEGKDVRTSYEEAFEHFRSPQQDLYNQHKGSIVPEMDVSSGLAKLFKCILGPPSLRTEELKLERDWIFCMAKVPLDHGSEMHERILSTLYRRFTADSLPRSAIGSHWQTLGFQGNDPGTDMRGVGMLGPLQMMYLLSKSAPLAADIFQLSQDQSRHFPFAVVSLNMTQLAIQILREQKLHAEINKTKKVVELVNRLYLGLFAQFYLIWKREGQKIDDFDRIKKMVAAAGRLNPLQVIKDLDKLLEERKKASRSNNRNSGSSFVDL